MRRMHAERIALVVRPTSGVRILLLPALRGNVRPGTTLTRERKKDRGAKRSTQLPPPLLDIDRFPSFGQAPRFTLLSTLLLLQISCQRTHMWPRADFVGGYITAGITPYYNIILSGSEKREREIWIVRFHALVVSKRIVDMQPYK